MKILTLIDSFKGSLSSLEAGEAVRRGALAAIPQATVTLRPLADGGEGTVDALVAGCNGEYVTVAVSDPLGRTVKARYGITADRTAVIEMSAAAGITLLSQEERDPLRTTTFGVGQMIRDAIERGCRRFLIGIGGSATNDGGIGMLEALGFAFLREDETPVTRGGAGLEELARIDASGALKALDECEFRIACDVTNPLCGELGCSAVYGPQKGASPEVIQNMDAWLAHYAALTKALFPNADAQYPGTGAAGGLGFAFLAFLGGELRSGISLVLEATDAARYIKDADLVVTGEGRMDAQSAMGKAPVGVARLAKSLGKPVIAFCGCEGEGAENCNAEGIDAYFPILRGVTDLETAMNTEVAAENLKRTAEQVFRLVKRFF